MSIRLVKHFVCAILVIGSILYAFHWLKHSNICLIRNVKVTGYFQHTGQENIKTVVEPLLLNRNIFNVKLKEIKKALLYMPWISTVTLARYWPGTLEIFIQEQIPVACWNDVSLINEKGGIFKPQEDNLCGANMPKLYGVDEFSQKVFYTYQKINKQVLKLGNKVKVFSMDNRFSVQVVLDNDLTIIVGRVDQINRFHRFAKNYAKINENKEARAESVDLRYPNGFAVKWKKIA